MNERIKELISKVGTDVSGKWIGVDKAEIFTELVVRECCREIVYSSVGQEDPVFAYEYITHLRNTFGIKE
jgi:hypothetical protein